MLSLLRQSITLSLSIPPIVLSGKAIDHVETIDHAESFLIIYNFFKSVH